jgi:putative ABC transport system ATP-binding protein
MITISGVSKYFNKNSAGEIRALNNLSLQVADGQYVILLGSNGSGKSTLLNVMAGQLQPDSGQLAINQQDVTGYKEHEMSRWVSRVFQNPLSGTTSALTILENFRIAALRTGSKSLKIGADENFRKTVREKISSLELGLENKLDARMGSLSGGQRQSLTLLMSVMDETKLLLMDEPASALDPKTAELVMKLAGKIIHENKLTTVLVTHQLRDAVNYGDRIIMMSEGRIKKDVQKAEKAQLKAEDIFNWF